MVNVSSLFGQIVSEIFTAVNFDNLVAITGAERNAKGFHCKTQLVSMLFCHLAGADSLREIVNGCICGGDFAVLRMEYHSSSVV